VGETYKILGEDGLRGKCYERVYSAQFKPDVLKTDWCFLLG